MKKMTTEVSLPEIGLVAVTRVALGVGIGLLLAERLDRHTRRGAGWALALVGGLVTIPLAAEVLGGRLHPERGQDAIASSGPSRGTQMAAGGGI